MTDNKVGFRNPPKDKQFKKGVCPNPKGRGAKSATAPGATVWDTWATYVEYIEDGRRIRGTRFELMVKSLAAKALKGDIKMAGAILDLYVPFAPKQPPGDIEISIENGLRLDD